MNLGGPQQRWVCVVRLLFRVKTHVKREYFYYLPYVCYYFPFSQKLRIQTALNSCFPFFIFRTSSLWISLHYHLLNKSTHKSNFYVCVYTVYWSNIAVYRLTCPVKITMHSWLVTSKYCYLCYLQYFLSCVFQFSWDIWILLDDWKYYFVESTHHSHTL